MCFKTVVGANANVSYTVNEVLFANESGQVGLWGLTCYQVCYRCNKYSRDRATTCLQSRLGFKVVIILYLFGFKGY